MIEIQEQLIKIPVKCPKCGENSEFSGYRCISATEENKMKDKLLSGTMFKHICPKCQANINVEHSFIYHQPEDALLFHYVVEDEEMKNVIKTFTEPDEEQKKFVTALAKEYTIVRITRKRALLLEKIAIYDAGLDDRAVELIKVFAASSYLKDNPDKKLDDIFFNIRKNKDNPENITKVLMLYTDNKQVGEVVITDKLYQQIYNDYIKSMAPLREDRNLIVNPAWAQNVMKLRNAKPNPAD